MNSFFKRYCNGEHDVVWSELLKLGGKIFEKHILSDALSVTYEFIDRVYFNLSVLHEQLQDIGYKFAKPNAVLVDASENVKIKIDEIEKNIGFLPLVAKAFYEKIDSVNFSQDENQLSGNDKNVDLMGLGMNSVLIFFSLDKIKVLQKQLIKEDEEISSYDSDEINDCDKNYFNKFFPIGSFASNNEPKGFILPDKNIDGIIYNDGAGDIYFAEELRLSFKWGGFPFWKNWGRYAFLKNRPNINKLLPVLTRRLKPL